VNVLRRPPVSMVVPGAPASINVMRLVNNGYLEAD
jgi:hypothetical protein